MRHADHQQNVFTSQFHHGKFSVFLISQVQIENEINKNWTMREIN